MSAASRPGGPWEPNPTIFLGYNQVYERSKYVVLPVPSDSGATCVPGSRFGPHEILSASRFLEPYDAELGFSPAEAGIHTLPLLEPVQGDPELTAERVGRQVAAVHRSGKKPVVVGGDHSLTPGAVAALASELGGELNLVVLDAHLDLYDEYNGSRFSHACSVRRAAEEGPQEDNPQMGETLRRSLLALYAMGLANGFSMGFAAPLVTLYIAEYINADPAVVASVPLVAGILAFLAAYPAGRVSDSVGRKPVIIWGSLITKFRHLHGV